MRNWRILAVDFDGVLCQSKWPEIGEPNEKFIAFLKKCQSNGDRIILNTCRVDERLTEAVRWCNKRGLYFDSVNENLEYQIEKYRHDCRKISADVYYDDKNEICEFEE